MLHDRACGHATPRALLRRINADVTQALALPDVKQPLRAMEFQVESVLPEEAERLLRANADALRKVAQQAGLICK